MLKHDRDKLRTALERILPEGWTIGEQTFGAPRGVFLVPPGGLSRHVTGGRWPGPGPMPKGLGLHRILATCEGRMPNMGHRSVFVNGPFVRARHGHGIFAYEDDRRRGAFTGRGWAQSMAHRMVAIANILHRGESP